MMKCVIIICLLSVSVCYSLQSATEDKNSTQTMPTVATNTSEATTTIVKAESGLSNPLASNISTSPAAVTTNPPVKPGPNDIKNNSKTADKDNKTDNKTNETIPNTVNPTNETKTKNDTTPTPAPANKQSGTKPDANDKKETTTTKSDVEVTSPIPKTVQASRAFDGASFVGGIILTLGLLAIGFMGFKYYKNQTERNYHTL